MDKIIIILSENDVYREIAGCCINDDAARRAAEKVMQLLESTKIITKTKE